jgi:pimeloyl-ACP methyl ester carboxylesterase
MTSSYSWRYLLEPLGSKYRLYVPDLPGCGESQPLPDRSHSGLALASFIGDLQAQLGVAACSVVGNSLGGYLCMQRALQEPQSFDRVVVIHAPAPPMDDSSHFAQVDSPAPLAGLVTGSSQLGYRDSRAKARSRESHHPWSARTRLS